MAKFLRKLATRTIREAAGIKEAKLRLEKGEKSRSLYTIGGVASSYKVGESSFGSFTEFRGEFVARPAEGNQEQVKGMKAYIPEPFQTVLTEAIDAQLAQVDESGNVRRRASVEFVIEVGIEEDEKSQTGYVYVVEPIIQPQQSDALGNLMEKAGVVETAGGERKIPAPRKRAKKED